MKILARVVFVLAAAAGLVVAAPAPAAPVSDLYTNFVENLTNLSEAQSDAAKKAALDQSLALFANTSNSFAADLIDGSNAIKKLEAAYGTSDANMTAFLDGHVAAANVAAFFRANQAYLGTQQKLLARGNLGAITRLAKVHLAQVKKYQRAFPETPDATISRLRRMKALISIEKYGAALAKRNKVELNSF